MREAKLMTMPATAKSTTQMMLRSLVKRAGLCLQLRRPPPDMLQLLKRMGNPELTAHGFRSTFKDWVSECTHYSAEVSEMALAHTIDNKVEAAYRRGDLFNKRVALMDDWAQFCGGKRERLEPATRPL